MDRSDVAVIVLGAGATRACSFVDPAEWSCLPPLNKDFFTQLQRVPDTKHQGLIKEVLKDVISLFGMNFFVTLEDVFSTLEHTIRMISVTGRERAYKKNDLMKMRARLMSAIAVVLEASLVERREGGRAAQTPRKCSHHEELVKRVLRPGDHIVSFNYDCVIDYALKERGEKKWNPRYGYGLPLGPRGARLTGDRHWAPGTPAGKGDTIHLHKLHGSLHFVIKRSDRVQLKQRPYTKQRGMSHFAIIPPESNKPYDKGVFATFWANAAQALGKAAYLIVIGYSLSPTDLHANALFRTSVRHEGLRSLVVVNPCQQDRARMRAAVQRGLSADTKILSFDTLQEFLATDVSVWR